MGHPDMHDVIQLYQMRIGLLSASQRDKLYQAYDQGMSPFVIGCAILRTSQEKRRKNLRGQHKRISFNYLWGIIQDWFAQGITDEASFRAYWQAQQRKPAVQNGGKHVQARTRRQVFSRDYEYRQRKPAAEGFFSFMDD
ncbi:MAG: DnaD domain protein [Firmicutes bacterium]|nr:DnaD domain protein [Bacillota bacterium]HKM16832.1 DnaD domain protein [Limnochordia bacterium]